MVTGPHKDICQSSTGNAKPLSQPCAFGGHGSPGAGGLRRPLAMLVALGAVYYCVRPAFYIEYFSNSYQKCADMELTLGWAVGVKGLHCDNRRNGDTERLPRLSRIKERIISCH